VTTRDDLLVATGASADPGRRLGIFDELMIGIGGRFRRVEPRSRARAFVLGLLAELPGKNCWTIAEHAGDFSPDGMQHLLARAKWDADGVRDDLRGYVIEHLGDPGPGPATRAVAQPPGSPLAAVTRRAGSRYP
jgi:DDE superfamily endonuclease